jgi:hypothetical protein
VGRDCDCPLLKAAGVRSLAQPAGAQAWPAPYQSATGKTTLPRFFTLFSPLTMVHPPCAASSGEREVVGGDLAIRWGPTAALSDSNSASTLAVSYKDHDTDDQGQNCRRLAVTLRPTLVVSQQRFRSRLFACALHYRVFRRLEQAGSQVNLPAANGGSLRASSLSLLRCAEACILYEKTMQAQ